MSNRAARGAATVLLLSAGLHGCAPTTKPPEAATPVAKAAESISGPALRESAIAVIERSLSHQDPRVRANAIEAAGAIPRRFEAALGAGLRDPNPGVRSVAATVVGRNKLTALSNELLPLTTDASAYVRVSALTALHRCGVPQDLSPLASTLTQGATTRERAHAAVALGELGDASALPMLRQAAAARVARATTSENRLMELQIAEAMVRLGDDEQLQTIRAALYPSGPEELEAAALAAQILGQVRDRSSARQLVGIAEFKDAGAGRGGRMPAEVRLAAVTALAQMGFRDGGYVADEFSGDPNPALRAQAAAAYGEIGGRASLAALERLLGDPEPLVAVAAASGIVRAVR